MVLCSSFSEFLDKLIKNVTILTSSPLKKKKKWLFYYKLLTNLQEIATVRNICLFACSFCILHYYLSTSNGIDH